jgi:hypothetical protein
MGDREKRKGNEGMCLYYCRIFKRWRRVRHGKGGMISSSCVEGARGRVRSRSLLEGEQSLLEGNRKAAIKEGVLSTSSHRSKDAVEGLTLRGPEVGSARRAR